MKTAVITGATRGMGKAIAEKFLQEGFQIAICARNDYDLYTLKQTWQSQFEFRELLAVPADLSDKEQVKSFGKKVLEKFPEGVDVLVNNAGTFVQGNLMDEPEGQLEALMNLNLFSVYHLTRCLLPKMIERQSGHIFNLCSVASLQAYPNGSAYGITKFALRGLTENLRYELRDKGVKVTAITPGAVWTDSWKDSGVPPQRMIQTGAIADLIWGAYQLPPSATVENIIVRPQLGDL